MSSLNEITPPLRIIIAVLYRTAPISIKTLQDQKNWVDGNTHPLCIIIAVLYRGTEICIKLNLIYRVISIELHPPLHQICRIVSKNLDLYAFLHGLVMLGSCPRLLWIALNCSELLCLISPISKDLIGFLWFEAIWKDLRWFEVIELTSLCITGVWPACGLHFSHGKMNIGSILYAFLHTFCCPVYRRRRPLCTNERFYPVWCHFDAFFPS